MLSPIPPILIIEDEPEIVEFIAEALESRGIVFQTTDNYPEAMSRLNNQVYTALVVDVKIKKGTGDKIINHIREEARHPNHQTPAIVTSGHLDRGILDALTGKVQGALVKPYSYDKLAEMLEALINARKKTS